MSKNYLDVKAMENELNSSAFFRMPEAQPAPHSPSPASQSLDITETEQDDRVDDNATTDSDDPSRSTNAPSNERTPSISFVRTPERRKRTITRYSFEFYRDQIESLQEFRTDELIQGEKGSMSQMVREAVDAYIAKRRRLE